MYHNIKNKITALQPNEDSFFEVAYDVYNYQKLNNPIFRSYLEYLGRIDKEIKSIEDFTFLPIDQFKLSPIKSGKWTTEQIFQSSGTTGSTPSQHHVKNLKWYTDLAILTFQSFFGSIKDQCVIGLLPGYLERSNSSLVYMVNSFIEKSRWNESGFYLDDLKKLSQVLIQLKNQQIPTVVFGVSFGLMEFAHVYENDYSGIKFIETGGMKGRAKELTRTELHKTLKSGLKVDQIYSEYGMTELLSQGYYLDQQFVPSSTMRVLVNEVNDPFSFVTNQNGQVNIIDLGNIDTCSFIKTADIGTVQPNGYFNVLGRLDNADIRGL